MNEIEAFERASSHAKEQGWPWLPPYWIAQLDGEWHINAENERIVRIAQSTGEVIAEPNTLSPASALFIAKEFATHNGLRWIPAFSLQLVRGSWQVGACQSQFGGQVTVQVNQLGQVIDSSINPK
jgi:hypothetical protein